MFIANYFLFANTYASCRKNKSRNMHSILSSNSNASRYSAFFSSLVNGFVKDCIDSSWVNGFIEVCIGFSSFVVFIFGAPGMTRTFDLNLRKVAL